MRSLTIVIPTYQRREQLHALLDSLVPELSRTADVEVVVVVDGSTDGSTEMLEAMGYPVPLRSVWQENAGLAAARNRGLEAAAGELIWLLDDDMIVDDGLLAKHRALHESGERQVVMGPCIAPPEHEVTTIVRDWEEELYGDLAKTGFVDRAVYFSAANTSASREVWRSVGGFDPIFVGWGNEDFEVGVRLLEAGVPIRYEHDAVAWHLQRKSLREFLQNKFDHGRNTVRAARIHPTELDELLPVQTPGRVARILRAVSRGRAGGYRRLARLFTAAAAAEQALTRGRSRWCFYHAVDANFLAGLADLDREGVFVPRLFGRSTAPLPVGVGEPGEQPERQPQR